MAYLIKVIDTNLAEHYHTVYTLDDILYSKNNDGMYRKKVKEDFRDSTPYELKNTIEEIIVNYNNLNPEDIIPDSLLEDLKLEWLEGLSPRKYLKDVMRTGDKKAKLIAALEEVGILETGKKGTTNGAVD